MAIPRFLPFVVLGAVACASPEGREPGEAVQVESASVAAASAAETAAGAVSASSGAAPSASAAVTSTAAAGSAPTEEPGDRIYAKGRFVWIMPSARVSSWIGYLTLGGSVRLYKGSAAEAKTAGGGCEAWYRVEPQGYVCAGASATLDKNDPEYVALAAHAGKDDPFPFDYGESTGTPRYFKYPSRSLQRATEVDLERHLDMIGRAREMFVAGRLEAIDPKYQGIDPTPASTPVPALPPLPMLIHENRDKVIRGSTVAWSKQYDDADGRTWLYTSDHTFVPKDRVKPYPKSSFQGIHLDAETRLPIAFFRKKDREKYRREGVAFVATGDKFERLAHVMLTDKFEKVGNDTYLETRQPGIWVLKGPDVAVARVASVIPFTPDENASPGRHTWVDISVLGGTLVAYEGSTPVFATLIAPGRGGTPIPGKNPVSTASTPTGNFRVDGKFRWATMVSSSDSNIVHSEVQWVQNFHGPHALHGAYWHDGWGELKSGGCVNLSPIDSKWVFGWTEPRLPKDWQGIRSVAEFGPPTRVIVRQ